MAKFNILLARWGGDRCSNKREKCHVGKLQLSKCCTLNIIQRVFSLFLLAQAEEKLKKNHNLSLQYVLSKGKGICLLLVKFYSYALSSNKLNLAVVYECLFSQ